MQRYDVTFSPDDNYLIQDKIEVDAADMESALDFVRAVFKNSVHIVDITAHRERIRLPKNLFRWACPKVR